MRGAAHADATPKPAAWEEENLKRKGPFDPPDPAQAAARAGVWWPYVRCGTGTARSRSSKE